MKAESNSEHLRCYEDQDMQDYRKLTGRSITVLVLCYYVLVITNLQLHCIYIIVTTYNKSAVYIVFTLIVYKLMLLRITNLQ